MGKCLCCGAQLTASNSMAQAMGGECWGKLRGLMGREPMPGVRERVDQLRQEFEQRTDLPAVLADPPTMVYAEVGRERKNQSFRCPVGCKPHSRSHVHQQVLRITAYLLLIVHPPGKGSVIQSTQYTARRFSPSAFHHANYSQGHCPLPRTTYRVQCIHRVK